MNGKDGGHEPEWPIRRDRTRSEGAQDTPPGNARPERDPTVVAGRKRSIRPVLLALGGLVLLLALLWLFTGNRSADQDKLTGNDVADERGAQSAEDRCASKATYDLIKRDLFRRAAQLRGSDQAAFDRLSAYATVRMENPVLESEDEETGASNCSGSLYIDLPPGVAVVGGRRTLGANVDYTIQPAADESGNVLLLRNAESIISPLATLARTNAASPPASSTEPNDAGADVPGADEGPGAGSQPQFDPAQPQPPAQSQPPTDADDEPEPSQAARPSFNCANARTRGERAVCGNPALASLDRQMSAQFFGALRQAGSEERTLLQRTRSRFLSYRDSCRSDGCIADAYRGRMREISDIMAGRWQPPR